MIDLDGDLSTVDDQSAASLITYDAFGRPEKSISDRDGNPNTTADQVVTRYEHGSQNRLSKVIYPDGTFTLYTYDQMDRTVSETDQLGRTTYYEYDSQDNLTAVILPKVEHPLTGELVHVRYEYSYNENGQQTSLRDNIFQTNPASAATIDRSGQRETTFTYDWQGRQISRTLPDGSTEYCGYEYDALNRLKELPHYAPDATPEDLSDNTVLQSYSYEYNQDNSKSQETFTDSQGQTHTWDWVYDQLGRLIKEAHDNADDSLDYITEYDYDLVGNRLEKRVDKGNDNTIDGVVQGVFDQNDRLLSETELVGSQEVRRTEYVYNQTEQIAKTVTDLINSRVETAAAMGYDSQGRLATFTTDTYTNGVKTQSLSQEYTYNSSGMKVHQVETLDSDADGVADGQSETSYLNDALNHTGYAQVLEERRVENGQPVKVTTYTIGHDVLSQFNSINGYLALLTDGHGSARAVANALGQVQQEYSYDAYGNAHGFDPALALTSLLYSGEQFNPESGRFNRLDPYSGDRNSPLSFHRYAYANMNPVMGIDPSGLCNITEVNFTQSIYSDLIRTAVSGLRTTHRIFKTVQWMDNVV